MQLYYLYSGELGGFRNRYGAPVQSVFRDNAMAVRTLSEVDQRMHHWEGA